MNRTWTKASNSRVYRPASRTFVRGAPSIGTRGSVNKTYVRGGSAVHPTTPPSTTFAPTIRRKRKTANKSYVRGQLSQPTATSSGSAQVGGIFSRRCPFILQQGSMVYRRLGNKLIRNSPTMPAASMVYRRLGNKLIRNSPATAAGSLVYRRLGNKLVRQSLTVPAAVPTVPLVPKSAAPPQPLAVAVRQALKKDTRPSREKRSGMESIGGVAYMRTKRSMVRATDEMQRVLAQHRVRRSLALSRSKVKDNRPDAQQKTEQCMMFTQFGKCTRPGCAFLHDADKVAVCRLFLRGACTNPLCPFSHRLSKERMPMCLWFLRGECTRSDCPYSHVKVSPDAPVCKAFQRGYCPAGEACHLRHVFVCPAFKKGKCSDASCPMLHELPKSKRKAAEITPTSRTTAPLQPTSNERKLAKTESKVPTNVGDDAWILTDVSIRSPVTPFNTRREQALAGSELSRGSVRPNFSLDVSNTMVAHAADESDSSSDDEEAQ